MGEPSQKYIAARDTLPKNLWPVFEQLVEEYRHVATVRRGSGYVALQVLANLVRQGWVCTQPRREVRQ